MQGERDRGVDAELVKVDLMNEDDDAYLNPHDRSEVACTATLHPTPYLNAQDRSEVACRICLAWA